jgi:hypothetical protein
MEIKIIYSTINIEQLCPSIMIINLRFDAGAIFIEVKGEIQ